MNASGLFLQAVMPPPARVAGVRLRPFSLGHACILARLECPFWANQPERAGRGDLVLALEVCRRPAWPTAREWIQTGRAAWVMRLYRLRYGFHGAAWWMEQAVAFCQYLATGCKAPPMEVEVLKGAKKLGAPELQLYRHAGLRLGRAEDEVMNAPFSLAVWDWATQAERDRGVTISDGKTVEMLRRGREAFAAEGLAPITSLAQIKRKGGTRGGQRIHSN